ncbi:MAG: hypothetical protein JNK33_01815 [Candidatus Doudnabacteria bacterium]|nr:hypothetical protein [Candidatus Doudnabacteria bacterium]
MLKQKTEEQFGDAFIGSDAIAKLVSGSGYFIRELDTFHGRPDVVLFDAQPITDLSLRNAILASPSSMSFASVFLALKSSRKSLDIEDIAMTAGISLSYTHNTVRALYKEGLLIRLKNGKFKLHPNATIPHTTIVSIEFKLHDWKKALKQSVRHRAFADKAFVIMPSSKRELLLSNIDSFAKFGISVAVFDPVTNFYETLHESNSDRLSEVSYLDVLGRSWINNANLAPVAA